MNEIKRWDIAALGNGFTGMKHRDDGAFVRTSDHEAEVVGLRAELQNAAKAALDATALACEKEREADAIRAELEEYKSLVRGIVDNRHKCFIPTDDPNSPTFNWDERADSAMGEGK